MYMSCDARVDPQRGDGGFWMSLLETITAFCCCQATMDSPPYSNIPV